MSKRKPTRREEPQDAPAADAPAPKPLKPRKGLFIALCAAFAIWFGCLTTLYFTTVYGRVDPHDHDHHHHDGDGHDHDPDHAKAGQ